MVVIKNADDIPYITFEYTIQGFMFTPNDKVCEAMRAFMSLDMLSYRGVFGRSDYNPKIPLHNEQLW